MDFNVITVQAWKPGQQGYQDYNNGVDNSLTNITSHILKKPPDQVSNQDIDKVITDNDKYGEDYKKHYGEYPPGWQKLNKGGQQITQDDRNMVWDGKDAKGNQYVVYSGTFNPTDASQPAPGKEAGPGGPPKVQEGAKGAYTEAGKTNGAEDPKKAGERDAFLKTVPGWDAMDAETQKTMLDTWNKAYGDGKDKTKTEQLGKTVRSDGFIRLDAKGKQAALKAAGDPNVGPEKVNNLINDLGFQGLPPDTQASFLGKYTSDGDFRAQIDKMMGDGRYKNADVKTQTNALKHMETYIDRDAGYKKLPAGAGADGRQEALENLWSNKLFNGDFVKKNWDEQMKEVGAFESKGDFKNWTPGKPEAVNADIKKADGVKDGPATDAYTRATTGANGKPDPTQQTALNNFLTASGDNFKNMSPEAQAAYIDAYNKNVEGKTDPKAGDQLKGLIGNDKFKGMKPEQQVSMLNIAAKHGAEAVTAVLDKVPDFTKMSPQLQESVVAGYNKAENKDAYLGMVNDPKFKELDPSVQKNILDGVAKNGFDPNLQKLVTGDGFKKLKVEQQNDLMAKYGTNEGFRKSMNHIVGTGEWAALGGDKQAVALRTMEAYTDTNRTHMNRDSSNNYDPNMNERGSYTDDVKNQEQVLKDLWDKVFKDPNNKVYADPTEAGDAARFNEFSKQLKGYFVGDGTAKEPKGPGAQHLNPYQEPK